MRTSPVGTNRWSVLPDPLMATTAYLLKHQDSRLFVYEEQVSGFFAVLSFLPSAAVQSDIPDSKPALRHTSDPCNDSPLSQSCPRHVCTLCSHCPPKHVTSLTIYLRLPDGACSQLCCLTHESQEPWGVPLKAYVGLLPPDLPLSPCLSLTG